MTGIEVLKLFKEIAFNVFKINFNSIDRNLYGYKYISTNYPSSIDIENKFSLRDVKWLL